LYYEVWISIFFQEDEPEYSKLYLQYFYLSYQELSLKLQHSALIYFTSFLGLWFSLLVLLEKLLQKNDLKQVKKLRSKYLFLKSSHFRAFYDYRSFFIKIYKRKLISINSKHDIVIKHDIFWTYYFFISLKFSLLLLICIFWQYKSSLYTQDISLRDIILWLKLSFNSFTLNLTRNPQKFFSFS